MTTCEIAACERPTDRSGLCCGHYLRRWYSGTALLLCAKEGCENERPFREGRGSIPRYCSPECRPAGPPRPVLDCALCGSPVVNRRTDAIYCSPGCQDRANKVVAKPARPVSNTCRTCERSFSRILGHGAGRGANRVNNYCPDCISSGRRGRDRNLRHGHSGYGLLEYERQLARQGGACAICSTTDPGAKGSFAVDHDHACHPYGKSCAACRRGLLCATCNLALGLNADDIDVVLRQAIYLAKHGKPLTLAALDALSELHDLAHQANAA